MHKRYILISIIFFLNTQWYGCEQEPTALLYPIPTLQVRVGVRKGFDLGVYKRDPQIKLRISENPDLEIQFLPDKDSLYVQADPGSPPLNLLNGKVNGRDFQLLVRVAPMVRHLFTYPAASPEDQVFVMGGFNDWSRTDIKLPWNGAAFQREVLLSPRRHEYKFVVNGAELLDHLNPDSVSNNLGGWNSILDLSQYQSQPAGRIVKRTDTRQRLSFDYLLPADQSKPKIYYLLFNNHLLHNDVVDFELSGGLSLKESGLSTGLLRITGLDSLGRVIPENQTLLKNDQPLNPIDHSGDWHFSVLYSIMVDRFLNGNSNNDRVVNNPDVQPLANWQGGDLAGIIQKLEKGYFRDLGVTSIWLSPLQRQPDSAYVEWVEPHRTFTGYHGYWPVDPRKVDPRFGTAEELKTLVDLAHRQGLKVIVDFVSNHVHQNHPYYREHRNWFGEVQLADGTLNIRRWDGETRLTTWFDTFLPSFDYLHAPEAIRQVTDDAVWWLKEFDLDGFRQDAVKHVPQTFWREFTRKVNQQNPGREIYQIGETFGLDELIRSYVNPAELSAQFNFAIYFNARGPFSADQAEFAPLVKVIEENLAAYDPVNLMGNITSSHDQVRFMAFADGQLSFSDNGTERAFTDPPEAVGNQNSYLKLANFQAFNISLPGVPVVYYGEEIGFMGAGDPDNRRMMKFNWTKEETDLRQEFGRLNRLRTSRPALALGDFIPILAKGPLLVYLKVYFDETILVAFNQSPQTQQFEFNLPLPVNRWQNLAGTGRIQGEGNQLSLTLPPFAHLLLLAEE